MINVTNVVKDRIKQKRVLRNKRLIKVTIG